MRYSQNQHSEQPESYSNDRHKLLSEKVQEDVWSVLTTSQKATLARMSKKLKGDQFSKDVARLLKILPFEAANTPWNPLDDNVVDLVRSKLRCNDIGYHKKKRRISQQAEDHKSIDMKAFLVRTSCSDLYELVNGCHKNRRNCNICVQGLPGTGKTICLKWIEKQMLGHVNVQFSYTNAYLKGNCDILKALAKNITCDKKMHILVMDEIDVLSEQELIEFYSLSINDGAWCICIGISNVLNFTEDSRLDRFIYHGRGPYRVAFEPFESGEISNILRKRLLQLPYDVFDSKVIDFIGKSCSKCGDIREAFKIADKAIQNCVTRVRNDSQPVSNHLVQITDVLRNRKTSVELTVPQLLLLRTLYHARKNGKNQYNKSQMFTLLVDYNREKDMYLKLRSLRKCPILDVYSPAELLSQCDSLACVGVVVDEVRKGSKYLRLAMSDSEARSILKAQNFIS
tara:strand:+ start:12252 stop:13616 length:1365 start_codon:yes stop_codon:yes gene_type:complete